MTTEKKTPEEMIAERFMTQLRNGTCPWNKPWAKVTEWAIKLKDKEPFSLCNQFLLEDPGLYAPFKQWMEMGYKIKKGEKAKYVLKPVVHKRKVKTVDENGNEKEEEKSFMRFTTQAEFHVSQVEPTENAKPLPILDKLPEKYASTIDDAEEMLNKYFERESIKVTRDIKSNNAYYSPMLDSINIPSIEQFEESKQAEYYSTIFHESAHSTGHPNRLNRNFEGKFGSSDYAKEELVAEITAAMLLSFLNIETDKSFMNSAAYINSWLQRLTGHEKEIMKAVEQAGKAVNYIRFGKEVKA